MKRFLALMKTKTAMAARNFVNTLKEERGDTNFVSIIVIIVIILAIAAIFQEQLQTAVERVFSNLMDFIG